MNEYTNLLLKVTTIEKKIDKIECTLSELVSLMKNEVSPSCNKMNTHITFVENIYNKIKRPLHYICNRFNSSKLLLKQEKEEDVD